MTTLSIIIFGKTSEFLPPPLYYSVKNVYYSVKNVQIFL